MKRLCIIRDSHVGALKLGWVRIKCEFSGIEITFFAGNGKQAQLKLEGEAIVPATAQAAQNFARFCGMSHITGSYDAFLLCGLGIQTYFAKKLALQFRTEQQPSDERRPISDECFTLAIRDQLANTFTFKLAGMLREISAAPIGLMPAPMPSAEHPDPDLKSLVNSGHDKIVAKAFALALGEAAAEAGVRVYPQPPATLVAPLCTNPVYSRAWGRESDVIDKDHGHMNAEYGVVALQTVLKDINAD